MQFKDPKLQAELSLCPMLLRSVAVDFERIFREETGLEPVCTRVFDPVEGESGVHRDRRAFDCRDEHAGARLTTDAQAKKIVDRMNAIYPRSDGKPTCLHHSFSGGPLHFHVQIPADPRVLVMVKKEETVMDKNKLIALIVGIVLSVGGALLGFNLKGEVCSPAPAVAAAAASK